MFEIFISLILSIFLVFSAGIISSKYLLRLNLDNFEIYELGFIGIFFLVFLSFIFHFFFALNVQINSFLFVIILVLFLINIKKFLFFIKSINLTFVSVSLLVVFVMTLKYKPNEDYGYYHLPYIINLVSEKIIFGLSNIQVNFAWNSTWLNFSSLFYLPLLKLKGTQLTNSVLFFFVIYFFLKESLNKENFLKLSHSFVFVFSCYVLIKFARISEHGFDFPANFYLIIAFYYFLKIFEDTNNSQIKKNFILLILFSIFCVTIKLSTFASPILVISSFILILKKKIKIDFLILPILFFSFFILFWFFQQFIYSGCIVPFFKFTCFESLVWYSDGITNAVGNATGLVNKSFNEYKGNLSSEEYLNNFNWASTWFERNRIEFLEHFAAFIVPFILILIFNFKSNFKNENHLALEPKPIKLLYSTIVLFIIIGISIWFLKSPVIRLGIPYLLLFTFFTLSLILKIFNFKYLKVKNGIKFILVLALFFNISKNLIRIKNSDTNTYWPKILTFNYSYNLVDKFKIYYPDSGQSYHKTKYCWSIPFICHMNGGENLKFQKILNYIVISID